MKKYLLFSIIFIIIFILLLSTGCEKQRIKNEIIKFDEEYYENVQEAVNYDNKFWIDLGKAIPDNEPPSLSGLRKAKKLLENYLDNYDEYIYSFRNLHTPEPLDDFYYEKLEQFDYYRKYIYIFLEATNDYIFYKEQGINYIPDDLIGKFDERDEYFEKASRKSLDCDRIRREVYREYGLDDLIDKW